MKKIFLILPILFAFNFSYATTDCVKNGISGFCGSGGYFQSNAQGFLNISEDVSLSIEERIQSYQALIKQINNDLKYLDNLVGYGGFNKNLPVTVGAGSEYDIGQTCQKITNKLWIGKTDANTNGDVTKLQNFLKKIGVVDWDGDGKFGTWDRRAVWKFQETYMPNISPTGDVGNLTMAKVNELICNPAFGGLLNSSRDKFFWKVENIQSVIYQVPRQRITLTYTINGVTGTVTDEINSNCTVHEQAPVNSGLDLMNKNAIKSFVNCYYALAGSGYHVFIENGKYVFKRGDESAKGDSVNYLTIKVLN